MCQKTARYPKTNALAYLITCLTEEVGEAARLYKLALEGEKVSIDSWIEEFGDIHWILSELERHFYVQPSYVLEKNILKLRERYDREDKAREAKHNAENQEKIG